MSATKIRLRFLLSLLLCAASVHAADDALHRYLYLASPDGAQPENASGLGILVFDIDAGFKFVRRVENPSFKGGIRGLTGCTATRSLYYSTTDHRLGRFDLETDKVVWEKEYAEGCDRSAITPDGKKIYAPTGFWHQGSDGGLLVIDGKTGELQRTLTVGNNAHNTIVSPDGKHIYIGSTTKLTIFDSHKDTVVKEIPDVGEFGVFPYTFDSRERYAYVCLGKHVGFDVVDLAQGRAIHRVLAGDAPIAHRTHGAALTPDETELWITDQVGRKLFIFDATKMPPAPKGGIPLSMGGHGWVNFSLDGQYAWTHTPDIFDARTKQLVATLKDENGKPVASSKLIEVHFRDGKVVRVGSEFGLGHKH